MNAQKWEDLELRTLKGSRVIIKTPEKEYGIGGAWIEGLGDTDASSFSVGAGEGKNLIASGAFKNAEIEPDFVYECFSFSLPMRGAVVLDKASSLAVREFVRLQHEERVAEYRARREAEEAALEAAVPGVTALRAAIYAMHEYQEEFAAAMADEMRDGVNLPVAPQTDVTDIDALAAQYPRAALYIRAEGYSAASHYAKAAAGDKARALLRNGGSLEEAAQILDSWTKDLYFD